MNEYILSDCTVAYGNGVLYTREQINLERIIAYAEAFSNYP